MSVKMVITEALNAALKGKHRFTVAVPEEPSAPCRVVIQLEGGVIVGDVVRRVDKAFMRKAVRGIGRDVCFNYY